MAAVLKGIGNFWNEERIQGRSADVLGKQFTFARGLLSAGSSFLAREARLIVLNEKFWSFTLLGKDLARHSTILSSAEKTLGLVETLLTKHDGGSLAKAAQVAGQVLGIAALGATRSAYKVYSLSFLILAEVSSLAFISGRVGPHWSNNRMVSLISTGVVLAGTIQGSTMLLLMSAAIDLSSYAVDFLNRLYWTDLVREDSAYFGTFGRLFFVLSGMFDMDVALKNHEAAHPSRYVIYKQEIQ